MARILVVDDEADMRLALSNVLSRTGYEVMEAPEGETALATVAREPLDLMLLDMRLPGMDGIQILKRVRETHPDLPVIMVTGYGSVDSAIEVMRLGASHYLAKPFSNKELLESVDRILHAKRVPVVVGRPDGTPGPSMTADGEAAPPPPARAGVLALPGPLADKPREFSWGLALVVGLAVVAYPLLSSRREKAREYTLGYSHPSALSWHGDRLWTADWMNQTVYEQEMKGGEVKVLRVAPLPQSHLTGIAITKEHLFVADDWRHEIQRRRLDAHLSLDRAIKSPGPKPSSLFYDGQHLWSADGTQGKIYQHELDDALTVIATYRSPGRAPVALYKDDRYFWSADGETRLIYRHRLDSKLHVLATYLWPALNEGPQQLSSFTLREDSAWIGRDGLSRLLEVPLSGFEVRHTAP